MPLLGKNRDDSMSLHRAWFIQSVLTTPPRYKAAFDGPVLRKAEADGRTSSMKMP